MGNSSISDIIKNRRATPPGLFAKREISREIIEALLESATWAPNHKKTEPWRFKIFRGAAKNKFAKDAFELLKQKQTEGYSAAPEKIEKFATTMERVPVAIAIVLQRDAAKRLPEWEEIAAVSMAVQNMWLHATELGLGAFWATPAFIELFDDLLGIETGQKCLGFFYVGEIMMDYPSPGRGELAGKIEWLE
jgi:nitroreductase